nr:DEAD/DEAH box helicase family protein [Lysobacter terrigena]
MVRIPTGLSRLGLHLHQKEAVENVIRFVQHRTASDDSCALVQMPTGSGKTGIIATLTRLCPGIRRALVIAPRVAIRSQLIEELSGAFFLKAGITVPARLVAELSAKAALSTEPAVLVTTVQMLDRWRRLEPGKYEALRANLDIVLMDEGHYEPASSWSKTVRDLRCPTVLLTATPYRNDLKTFRISEQGVSTLRFRDAVSRGVIRDVQVLRRGQFSDPDAYCRDVIAAFESHVPAAKRDEAKIIIRCEDAASIRRLCNAFRGTGRSVIGIHDRFTDARETWLRDSVPARGTERAQVWIHQFKLLEGVDEPSFRMLAVFGPAMNVRAFVQQVGRVTRNPGNRTGETAFVLDHHEGRLEQTWHQFLEYDAAVTADSLANSLAKQVNELLRTGFSGLQYFDREFKAPFSFDRVASPLTEFRLPKDAYILRTDHSTVERVRRWVVDQLGAGDCEWREYDSGESHRLLLAYTRASSSRLLSGMYFLEPRLGLVAATLYSSENLIAFHDSGGMLPVNALEAGICGAPPQASLSKVIKLGPRTRISEVATRNSSAARGTSRTRTTTAPSMDDLSPYLDDFQHVVTAVTGYSDESATDTIRRYVGYRRGRVSQSSKSTTVDEYFSWSDDIVAKVASTRARGPTLLSRYSRELPDGPANTAPRNVLVDFAEASTVFALREDLRDAGEPLEVDDACVDCVAHPSKPGTWQFELVANGQVTECEITYDARRRQYVIASKSLDDRYVQSVGSEGLVSWLNRRQSFNVVPASRSALYVHGSFFDPQIPTGRRFDPSTSLLSGILHPISGFRAINSEKGATCAADGSGWEAHSLFGRIDAIGDGTSELAPFLPSPDVIICDDLNKETCDFFLANNETVVMAHAKAAASYKPLSASALQEVVGQAVKNASFLSMLNMRSPPNLKNWGAPWRTGKTPTGQVLNRIRRGPAGARDAWSLLDRRIRAPDTSREVWLVLGATMSKSALVQELAKESPAAQAFQAAHLLHSCWAAVSASGARLRVFCSD